MRIGVSGHQRLPSEAVAYIRQGITAFLDTMKSGLIGVSSLAAGADQVFASAVLEAGGRLHVILPCHNYEGSFDTQSSLDGFWALFKRAEKVDLLDHPEPSEEAFLDAGRRVVDSSDLLLAVWDGKPAKGRGGTGDAVEYARSRGTKVEVIWPEGVTR